MYYSQKNEERLKYCCPLQCHMKEKIADYAKLLRLPGLGGLAIPPVFGAISVGVYDVEILVLLFIIGSLSAMYGFILNDYADVELDSLVKELKGKPLVKGSIAKKTAVGICLLCVILVFFFAFYLWRGEMLTEYKFAAIVCLVFAGILGSIYDLYGKHIAGSDFFVAISMALVFLFGALSAGECVGVLTWVIFFLTFNQTLHMNAVEGGIKDADHDHIMGVKNIALSVGVKIEDKKVFIPLPFKAFGMGIRSFSAVLIFIPFFYDMDYYTWQIILLLLFLVGVFYIEARLLTTKIFHRGKIRKLIANATFLRYSIVPIMLISKIGIVGGIILIILPIAWYIVFAPLLGVKLFQPEM